MKNWKPYLIAFAVAGMLIFGYTKKDWLNGIISAKMSEDVGAQQKLSIEEFIKKQYNYSENKKEFDFTLLEFGTGNCALCKQLEPVLNEIRKSENPRINVVFIHSMKPENQVLIKYYGVSATPMLVLLDENGKQILKHYGYIGAGEIISKTKEKQKL